MAILVLAAGESSRMGRPKQLLPWKKGTLLQHSLKNALEVSKDVFVVLGAHYENIAPTLSNYPISILRNTQWKMGMGASIATGLREITKENYFNSVLIILGDQPLLEKNHLSTLIQRFKETPSKIVATKYGEKGGVPAIFEASLFKDLAGMTGNSGAKQLINSQDCETLSPVGIPIDIDTLATYKDLFEQYGQ